MGKKEGALRRKLKTSNLRKREKEGGRKKV